ncbi:unnamed protein product, partial [Mesorhabditis belari]|uniref:Arp2/3 complex 16 kDa subunit n=1 Tax=Mesorhabditis belari TaxID=2138241 RepID=A0AAF3J3K8_9BILA
MAKHHPDLIFCRKQPGVAIGRLCDKCDGRCVICDSFVRPATLVRICDECNYGSYQGRCVICGGPGVSDAYYCKECTIQEKDRDGCPKIVNLEIKMAKNMNNTSYRKLDVDALDDERYDEDEGAESAALGPDERSVQSYLQTSRLTDALHAALTNPPLTTKNQQIKDRSTLLVAKVLQAFKTAEIEGAIKVLSEDEGDLLMKYVYKIMEINQENAVCASTLSWHAQLVARFGLGSIIRVLSDRRRL